MIFFALLVTLLALFAGCLHGGREAYHADSTIFEKRWNVAKTSFFGSFSWLRKYQDYDSEKKEKSWYTPISDFWHVSAWAWKIFLIAACLLSCYYLPFHIVILGAGIYILESIGASTTYKLLRYKTFI